MCAAQARCPTIELNRRTMTTERNIRRTVLPNGLIVLTERLEFMLSVAMGV